MNPIKSNIEYLIYDVGKLIQMHKPKEAMVLIEEILAIEPTYSKAHYYLGRIYQDFLDQSNMAESHYRLAIKFNPPCPDAFIQLGRLVTQKGQLAEAGLILQQGLQYEGIIRSDAYEALGKIYEKSGKYLLARKFYKLAVRSSLDDSFIIAQQQNIKRCRQKFFML